MKNTKKKFHVRTDRLLPGQKL